MSLASGSSSLNLGAGTHEAIKTLQYMLKHIGTFLAYH